MEEMSTAAETIEKLAREAERLQILELARGCKDLDELIKKLETTTSK
nr:protein phosphatase [uncultured Oscillibacter sp.]